MSEQQQAMLERMQQLEEALHRAETGCATGDDWSVIRFECGLTRQPKPSTTWSEV